MHADIVFCRFPVCLLRPGKSLKIMKSSHLRMQEGSKNGLAACIPQTASPFWLALQIFTLNDHLRAGSQQDQLAKKVRTMKIQPFQRDRIPHAIVRAWRFIAAFVKIPAKNIAAAKVVNTEDRTYCFQ